MGMQSCARAVDAAHIGHWALVGTYVHKMLPVPHLDITGSVMMQLQSLLTLKAAADLC